MKFKFFMKMKHWKLFLFLFSLPVFMFLLYFLLVPNVEGNIIILVEMSLLQVYTVCYSLWLYSLSTNLRKIHNNPDAPKAILKYSLYIIITYTVAINIFLFSHYLKSPDEITITDNLRLQRMTPVMIAGQIYSTLLYIYTLYLISKDFISVEKKVHFFKAEVIKVFLLLFFSPIGVWFLQPRINKLFEKI